MGSDIYIMLSQFLPLLDGHFEGNREGYRGQVGNLLMRSTKRPGSPLLDHSPLTFNIQRLTTTRMMRPIKKVKPEHKTTTIRMTSRVIIRGKDLVPRSSPFHGGRL